MGWLRPELLQRLGLVQHGGELPEAAVPGRLQFERHWWSHAYLVPRASEAYHWQVLLPRLRPELLQRLGLVQPGGELPEAAVPGRLQFERHRWSHADLVPSAGETAAGVEFCDGQVLLQRLRPELLQRLGLVQHGGELPEAAVPGRVQFEH